MTPVDALEIVTKCLIALDLPGVSRDLISEERLLIADLGLDSVTLVQLAVELEEALGLPEFPLQAWADEQLGAGRALTVGRLAECCLRLVAPPT